MKQLVKHISKSLLIAALLGGGVVAHASLALAGKNNCLTCHQVNLSRGEVPTTLGPSFQQIAVRYRGDKTAPDKLVKKILAGGNGQWGTNNMPPQFVPDDEAKALVRWILKRK